MASSRPLLIPQKRPLLFSGGDGEAHRKPIPKVLNPSATAAETRMKKANPYVFRPSIENEEDNTGVGNMKDHDDVDDTPARIEFSFAMPPQPFLDPPRWEAMLKQAQLKTAPLTGGAGKNRSETQEEPGPSETPDQRRQRREREAEYGSMAIRDRSNVSGRGRRGRMRGNIAWSGR